MNDAELQLFALTVILGEPLPADWPASFVIINAWATTGETWSDERNQAADEALRQALQQAAQRNPTTEVQLRADTAVPYGRVVEFMALANAAGLSRIGFVTETPQ